MTRDDALKILEDLKNSPIMVKHELAVGFVMAALFDYLKDKGKSPEMTKQDWEIVGIMHDADYEYTNKSLELHTEETTKKLEAIGADQQIIDAVRGHCDKTPRTTLMAKAVYAIDELTGLIVACALVKPDKKLSSVSVESVMKKFKDKYFAAGANRDQIKTCEEELGIPLDEFVKMTLETMQKNSTDLGL
ncbi:MAG: phosphohydrolase [Candidatus Curtissbacteria bacterium]